VAVGEANGAGKPDVVVANEDDGTVGVLLGNGGGSFRPARSRALDGEVSPKEAWRPGDSAGHPAVSDVRMSGKGGGLTS
jgi:hypothetical protein